MLSNIALYFLDKHVSCFNKFCFSQLKKTRNKWLCVNYLLILLYRFTDNVRRCMGNVFCSLHIFVVNIILSRNTDSLTDNINNVGKNELLQSFENYL